jgi:hypothetical protein
LYSYTDLEVPPGVKLRDAREVLPEEELFQAHGSYAAFSDFFRHTLLLRRGGWWVDADVISLRKREESSESNLYAWQDHRLVNCGQIRLKKGSEVAAKALAELNRLDKQTMSWADPGPVMFTRVLRELDILETALDREQFYPLHWLEVYKLLLSHKAQQVSKLTGSSDFLHGWGSRFNDFGFDIWNHRPQAGSFLDSLYSSSLVYQHYKLASPDWKGIRDTTTDYLSQDWVHKYEKEPMGLDLQW